MSHSFQVNLAWDPNPGGDTAGYKLYYGNSSGIYDRSLNLGNITTCTVANLQDGLHYYFTIVAYNRAGQESEYSNEVTCLSDSRSSGAASAASVPGPVPLIGPSGNITRSVPAYTWSAVPGADMYYLWVDDASGVKINVWLRAADVGCPGGTGTCTAAPTTTLPPGRYGWNVQARNSAGKGQWSSGLTFQVSSSVSSSTGSSSTPQAVPLISPSGSVSTGTPTYTWRAVPGADVYYLWVDDDSGVKVNVWLRAADVGCPNGTGTCAATPSAALSSGDFGWNVQARNSAGKGPWSNGLTFNVAPSNGGSSNTALISPYGKISQSSPTYTWRAVSGVSWYRLWVDDPSGKRVEGWYSAATVGCPTGSGTCSINPGVPLNPGTFGWNIQTWNSSGTAAWASGLKFTVGY